VSEWFEQQYPKVLSDAERRLLTRRRLAAGVTDDRPVVGVAWSGGGIRSATFVLGFCQGLAQLIDRTKPGLLRRVDLMSTVSGGGYFGAFLGALYLRLQDASKVEARLNNSFSKPIQWLRENGRYLAPNGSGDSLLAASVVLRNWTAVTVVISTAILTMLTGAHLARIAARNVLEAYANTGEAGRLAADAAAVTAPRLVFYWSPYAFPAAIVFAFVAVPLGWAYWLGRWSGNLDHQKVWGSTFVVTIAAVLETFIGHSSVYHPVAALLAFIAGETLALALVVSLLSRSSEDDPSGDRGYRNRLSRWMAVSLLTSAALALLAFVDTLGQSTYALAWRGAFQQKTIGSVVTAIVSLVGAAQALPKFLDTGRRSRRVRLPVNIIAGIAAIVVLLVLFTSLSAVSHGVARHWQPPLEDPACATVACGPPPLPRLDGPATSKATVVLIVVSLFFGISLPFVNLSSLSQFYSARLSRTYIGASNPERQKGAGVNLTEEVPGDDLALDRYVPHEHGGPVHIINVTLNETVGGRSQIEDRDRKGLAMAVGPSGVSVGVSQHATWKHDGDTSRLEEIQPQGALGEGGQAFRVWSGGPVLPKRLSLSQWTSISGAAVAPGMGAQTSLALSLLLGLANVRLGYWWDSGVRTGQQGGTRPKTSARVQRFLAGVFPVQSALLREFVGQFHGPHQRLWFLSDGGHFENTACYELLRRRVPIIIVCDDGADPHYEFEDLANLVRKARLDFGAEIRLLQPPTPLFGAAGDLRPRPSDHGGAMFSRHHVIAAQVLYPDEGQLSIGDAPARAQSLLIIVKPSVTGDEPLDVLQYAASHPTFPQETTSDQFFDEAQWESYRKLGEHVGTQVNLLDVDALFSALKAPAA